MKWLLASLISLFVIVACTEGSNESERDQEAAAIDAEAAQDRYIEDLAQQGAIDTAYSNGLFDGQQEGYDEGRRDGYDEGYQEGYDEGYYEGCDNLGQKLVNQGTLDWYRC